MEQRRPVRRSACLVRVFVDTNILAYLFDNADPHRQQRARNALAAPDIDRRISTQVLIELHSVLTRRLNRTKAEAEQVLGELDYPTITTDHLLVSRAAGTATRHQLSIFDALILEAAAHASCDELWSEDFAEGTTVRGVRIVNPLTA